jgi:transcriptional regulator with XRE-family HTH domain
MATTFGGRLRQARKNLGLTQVQLAEALGVTQGQITMVETDKSVFSIEVLARVHNLYGISPTWLITGKGQMREGEAVA